MLDNNMSEYRENYRNITTGQYDFSSSFAQLRGLLSKSDYVIGNLETPISDQEEMLTHKQWEFCSPYEFAEALKNSGVSFVTTANNHCLDRGIAGIISTISCLDKIGLEHCGIQPPDCRENDSAIVDIGRLRLGVLAYTY